MTCKIPRLLILDHRLTICLYNKLLEQNVGAHHHNIIIRDVHVYFIDTMYVILYCRPSPFVYFPFSTGTRACIGKQFGLVSYISVLAINK